MKTLDYYIKFYKKHTGETFVRNERFLFYFHPEHGFCEYYAEKDCLYIWQMCGDLKYWLNIAVAFCHQANIPRILAYTVRHVKPFIRALGFKIRQSKTVDNQTLYRCRKIANNKDRLVAKPYGDRYTLCWHLNKNSSIDGR